MIIEQSDLNRGASNQFEHSSWQSMSWLLIIISSICDVWKPLFVWSWSKMVWYIHISIIHNKFLLLLEQFHLEKKVIDIVQTMTWCQSFSLTIYLLIISRKKMVTSFTIAAAVAENRLSKLNGKKIKRIFHFRSNELILMMINKFYVFFSFSSSFKKPFRSTTNTNESHFEKICL